MADIFLSYAREDLAEAERVAQALGSLGWTVWWDRDLAAGDSFEDIIERELCSARCVVVMWSQFSTKSHWVKDEAREAQRRRVLVTARIDGSDPPLGFRGQQTADLSRWDGTDSHVEFRRLTRGIDSLAPLQPTPGASFSALPATRPPTGNENDQSAVSVSRQVTVSFGDELTGKAGDSGLGGDHRAVEEKPNVDREAINRRYDERDVATEQAEQDDNEQSVSAPRARSGLPRFATPLAVVVVVAFVVTAGIAIYDSKPSSQQRSAEVMTPAAPAAAQRGGTTPPPDSTPPFDEGRARSLAAIAEAHPQESAARIELGNLYFDAERFDEAIKWYQAALQIEPNNTNVRTDLGVCFYYINQPDRALEHFTSALSIDPKHTKALLNMGIVRAFGKQDLKGAAQDWQRVIDIAPDSEEAQLARKGLAGLKAAQ